MHPALAWLRLAAREHPRLLGVALAVRAVLGGIAGFGAGAAGGFDPWLLASIGILLWPGAYAWRYGVSLAGAFVDPLPPHVHHRVRPTILIRRVTRSDVEGFAATMDGEVERANGWQPEVRQAFVDAIAGSDPWGRYGVLAVCDTADERLLGVATISDVDWSTRSGDVGFWMGPLGRGRGLATTALAGALEVFHDAGIVTARIGTATTNVAMQRVIAGAGAVLVDQRAHTLPNGDEVASLWFEHVAATPVADGS